MSGCQGLRGRENGGGAAAKGHGFQFGLMKISWNWRPVIVAQP